MSKLSRHKAILELLHESPVPSQEELQRLLHRRGFRRRAGDALPRHSRAGAGEELRRICACPAANRLPTPTCPAVVSRLVREFVTSVRAAENLLVTKTSVGSAQPVAAALDEENWPEAIGTIAGDDTILIVCQDRRAAGRLADRIQGMLA